MDEWNTYSSYPEIFRKSDTNKVLTLQSNYLLASSIHFNGEKT